MKELQVHGEIDQPAHYYFSVATRGQPKRGNDRNTFVRLYQRDLHIQEIVSSDAGPPCFHISLSRLRRDDRSRGFTSGSGRARGCASPAPLDTISDAGRHVANSATKPEAQQSSLMPAVRQLETLHPLI
jgi:hypothetical protein